MTLLLTMWSRFKNSYICCTEPIRVLAQCALMSFKVFCYSDHDIL